MTFFCWGRWKGEGGKGGGSGQLDDLASPRKLSPQIIFLVRKSVSRGGGVSGSHILTIRVYAAGKGIVFKPFTLGLVITESWSRI